MPQDPDKWADLPQESRPLTGRERVAAQIANTQQEPFPRISIALDPRQRAKLVKMAEEENVAEFVIRMDKFEVVTIFRAEVKDEE